MFHGSLFGTKNRKPENDIIIDEMLQLKESCSSFRDQDYVEEIEELQFYVDMVKYFKLCITGKQEPLF